MKTYKKYRHINNIPANDKNITTTIDINAIRYNINFLHKKTGTDIMPVLKGDAYGHGMIKISKILRDFGIKYIAVATLGEAILLRKSGDKGRILAWLYNINGYELIDAFHLDIDIAIFDENTLTQFIELIPKNKVINITVFVDTGINRAGVRYSNAFNTCKIVNDCYKMKLVGIMSHLSCSHNKNCSNVHEQLSKFRILRNQLKQINIDPPLVHIANTGGCINYDVSDFTISRVGSGIFGITYNKYLHPVMSLYTSIIQIKEIDKGEGIGYDSIYFST